MENEKLFAKSFIYCRQIDSLSNQSARTTRELFLVLSCFFSTAPPSIASSPRSCLVLLFSFSLLAGINNFYRPSGRRNGKRRRPFNFSRVWRVFHYGNVRSEHHTAISSLLWRLSDADENKTWRVQQTSLLMLRLANYTHNRTVLISRRVLFHLKRRDVSNENLIEL